MAHSPHEPLPVTAGPELFGALGGRAAVGMIVDGLYDRLEYAKELSRMFRSRRQGERDRLKELPRADGC
jgi:truncated hemoglobin YjbI